MAGTALWSDNTDITQTRGLARAISLVENESPGYLGFLAALHIPEGVPVIGITGPPGAGKSTLVNALIGHYAALGKKTGVIAVDPTSPFNFGSLLGDRIRMAAHFSHPNVFIRSLATRGSLGGLSAKTIEITDLMKAAGFDIIIVETVGVGQSEVEISGLADTTIVVLVPESGDEIQVLKSGIMEIADIFVVNKSDRPGANEYCRNLLQLTKQKIHDTDWHIPVISAIASQGAGIEELTVAIEQHSHINRDKSRKSMLLAAKAWQIIQHRKMKDIKLPELAKAIANQLQTGNFNVYRFVDSWL